ncbi:MAG: phosphate ABC transporter permease subunit PstC [Pseudomonadota bacterium]
MSVLTLLALIAIVAATGFVLGKRKALAAGQGHARGLHSLPNYYGGYVMLWVLVPGLLLLAVWLIAQPMLINSYVSGLIPASAIPEGGSLSLVMSEVTRLSQGMCAGVAKNTLDLAEISATTESFDQVRELLALEGVAVSTLTMESFDAAIRHAELSIAGSSARNLVVIAALAAGLFAGLRRITASFRARNAVEQASLWLLIAAASIAILTTVGIVLSLIFNTIEFFGLYPASEFFFSLVWSPSFGGGSELGILPLLWGTLYISLIALLVAVPIGLLSAIYLSEYASATVRSFAKPMLEVLAGIPTIVYGLFALLTVGPFLVSFFGQGGYLGVNWMAGGTAVMTAGLVMGVMLIPFVSSLSDDIINAVPQAMRDGSLGLGATKSETIKQVVLPAALPGIVGAILLAASRAIGETMIVVLGAGAAARLSMNPFDAMTTVTAKIVSQLTGDSDFASPEALVAFALGMTLFVITLGLNVFALYIVRKYREQYE